MLRLDFRLVPKCTPSRNGSVMVRKRRIPGHLSFFVILCLDYLRWRRYRLVQLTFSEFVAF